MEHGTIEHGTLCRAPWHGARDHRAWHHGPGSMDMEHMMHGMDHGPWTMGMGMEHGPWTMAHGAWTMERGAWSMEQDGSVEHGAWGGALPSPLAKGLGKGIPHPLRVEKCGRMG